LWKDHKNAVLMVESWSHSLRHILEKLKKSAVFNYMAKLYHVLFSDKLTPKLIFCFPLQSYSFSFLMILILSLVMGIVLNFTMFLCTIVNSALTTTIVGVLKGVVSTVS